MTLSILEPIFSVCKLSPESSIPDWAQQGSFYSISKTFDELSIVCEQSLVPEGLKIEKDWRALKVEGPLDFSLTGILSSIAKTLAENKISIFAISTFDTDYILVKDINLESAKVVLAQAGFDF